MNKFYVNQQDRETKENLQLGDIISWHEHGYPTAKYMIYRTIDYKIGLIDVKTCETKNVYGSMKEITNALKDIETDNNRINVLDNEDWTIYVP